MSEAPVKPPPLGANVWDTEDGQAPFIDKLEGKPLFKTMGFGESIVLAMAIENRPENGWLKNLGGLKFDVRPLTFQTVSIRVYHETTGDSAEFTLTVKD